MNKEENKKICDICNTIFLNISPGFSKDIKIYFNCEICNEVFNICYSCKGKNFQTSIKICKKCAYKTTLKLLQKNKNCQKKKRQCNYL